VIYTVIGFHTNAEAEYDGDPHGYQRFADHVEADSAEAAERAARAGCSDKIVAAVIEGPVTVVR